MSVYLDRRVENTTPGVTISYSGGETDWFLPYDVPVDGSSGVPLVVRQDTREVIPATHIDYRILRAVGDYRTVPVYIGISYDFVYQPTRLYLRDQDGSPETRGRLQLRYLDVHFANTTDLRVVTTLQGRPSRTTNYSTPEPTSGHIRIPVQSQNTAADFTIYGPGPGAVTLTGLDWEGFYTSRTRRV